MEKKIIFEDKKNSALKDTITKPIILIDIDDTIADFGKFYWELHNRVFKDTVDYFKVNKWDLDKFSKRGLDAYKLFKYPGLFRNLPPKPYAKEFMEEMQKVGDVLIVSDAPSGTSYGETVDLDCVVPEHRVEISHSNPADDKRMWLKEHFNIDKKNVIFCSNKEYILGDILIDDKPSTFEKFSSLGRNIILIDAPYNRHIQTEWRAKDLNHAKKLVYRMLEEMSKEEAS